MAVPRPGTAQTSQPPDPSTAGYYTLQFSSRTLDAHLFGNGATGRAQVLVNQQLRGLGTLALWLERGFPTITTDFGVELRDVPLWGGYAQINGGDFLLRPLMPDRAAISAAASRSIYPLQGGRYQQRGARSQWTVFAGRAKRFRELPDQETKTPSLFGIQHLRRMGFNYFGFSFTGVESPSFVTDRGSKNLTGIGGGSFYRNISPRVGILAEVHTTGTGIGGRAVTSFQFRHREFETEYGIVGGSVRQVEVQPRRTVQADFQLAVMRYFQGSVVTCEGDVVQALADVEITLVGQGVRRTLRTSRVGGFQFDELPPGRYDLVVPSSQPGEAPQTVTVDLTRDLAGFLLRINCP